MVTPLPRFCGARWNRTTDLSIISARPWYHGERRGTRCRSHLASGTGLDGDELGGTRDKRAMPADRAAWLGETLNEGFGAGSPTGHVGRSGSRSQGYPARSGRSRQLSPRPCRPTGRLLSTYPRLWDTRYPHRRARLQDRQPAVLQRQPDRRRLATSSPRTSPEQIPPRNCDIRRGSEQPHPDPPAGPKKPNARRQGCMG